MAQLVMFCRYDWSNLRPGTFPLSGQLGANRVELPWNDGLQLGQNKDSLRRR